MFDNGGGPMTVGQECKPDYEKQVATALAKLKRLEVLKETLMDFVDNESTHMFNKISSLAEFIGGVEIMLSQAGKTYDRYLKVLENQ